MTDFDPDAYLHNSSSQGFDPDVYLSQAPVDISAPVASATSPGYLQRAGQRVKEAGNIALSHPFTVLPGALENSLSGITSGVGSLADVVTGAQPGSHDWAYRPRTEAGKELAQIGGQESHEIGQVYDRAFGTGPAATEIKGRIPEFLGAAGTVTGLIRGGGAIANRFAPPGSPSVEMPPASDLATTGAPRGAPFEIQDVPGRPGIQIDTEPVEGGLPEVATNHRAQILSRVGLENARTSALEGNAQDAATDWQLSKFDEPAGVAAKAQFDAERNALRQHAENLVQRTGGTLGTDEDTLSQRGQTQARPFEAMQDWFEQRRQNLYRTADQRSGGHPVVQPLSLRATLDDPSFQNQLTARDQISLRNGISAELERFQRTNPEGLTVQNAEQFRQFLNSVWTPQTSQVVGRLKGQLDNDVLAGAGEDIYREARQMSQIEHQTLQNPSGINQIMERDPQTPINRRTPYEKIPDTIARLPSAQFDNVMRTLDAMPEEIQPLAMQAKAEIKAHLANKIYDAGTSTQGQWNARAVEKVIRGNSAKLQSAFQDQPEVLQGIQDLRSAGNILSVNQGYPGAAAQAANALKRGLMSRAITHVAGAAGGAVGSSIGGPLGAAAGTAIGEGIGSKMGASAAERAAIRNWNQRTTPLPPSTER